jgi:hypothetical protein
MVYFRPRFSIASLLAVTAAIVLMLSVSDWREYLRRMEFERAARKLSSGLSEELLEVLPRHSYGGGIWKATLRDVNGSMIDASFIQYKRYWYCIYANARWLAEGEEAELSQSPAAGLRSWSSIKGSGKTHWNSVDVYRMPAMPPGYLAQTTMGRSKALSRGKWVAPTPREQYYWDFLATISGKATGLRFEYRLIHSSPQESKSHSDSQ